MLKRYVVCIGFVNDVLSMLMNLIFCVFFFSKQPDNREQASDSETRYLYTVYDIMDNLNNSSTLKEISIHKHNLFILVVLAAISPSICYMHYEICTLSAHVMLLWCDKVH